MPSFDDKYQYDAGNKVEPLLKRWAAYLISLGIVVTSLLSCAVYWWYQESTHQQLKTETQSRNEQRALQFSTAIAEQMDALVRSFDLAARQLRETYVNNPRDFESVVRSVIETYPSGCIKYILVFDADGYLSYSSSGSKERIYFGDREHFRVHADSKEDRLFISKPVFGRVGNVWVILMTRPIYKDGRFAGVIVMSLQPAYLAQNLAALKVTNGDTITLLRTDGSFLARNYGLDEALGKTVPPDRPFLKAQPGESGFFRAPSTIEHSMRLFAWQRLANWPLIVTFGLDERAETNALEASFHAAHWRSAIGISFILIFSLGIAYLLVNLESRKRELQNSEQRYRSLIQKMQTAIVVYDAQGQVLMSNPLAQELLGFSPDQFSGQSENTDGQFLKEDGSILPASQYPAKKMLSTGQPIRNHVVGIQRPDSEATIWVLINAEPEYDSVGKIALVIVSFVNITENRLAEQERLEHLRYFESMDRINRAIQGATDLKQMMSDVLDVTLSVLGSDRAWLVYPCDPDAASWQTPMERTVPEYPGASILGLEIPMGPDIQHVFNVLLASEAPIPFGPGAEQPLAEWLTERFSVQSQIGVAIYPKLGKPYAFGLHQCSYARVWTDADKRLIQEIGWRIADALTSLSSQRDLLQSEHKLKEAQRIAQLGSWERDFDADSVTVSDEASRILGLQPHSERGLGVAEWHKRWLDIVHPHDQQKVTEAYDAALLKNQPYKVEYRVVHPNGDIRIVHCQAEIIKAEAGHPRHMTGTIQDITERKLAEQNIALMTLALNNVHESAILTDENANFLYVNEEVCRTLGYSRDELLDMSVADIDPEMGVEHWQEHWSGLKQIGSSIIEGHHKAKDGRQLPVEIRANYFEFDDKGYNLALIRDVTERKQAEQERLEHLRYFESMDRVNRAIQGATDLEQMMSDVLDVVTSILDCDRAFLMYPCDPDSPTWFPAMERTKPDYPGVLVLGHEVSTDQDVAETFRILLGADGPVRFGPGTGYLLPKDVSERFNIKCFMSMALFPKVGKPWQFGIHQCSHVRIWTREEEQLFREIGWRLADALTSLLSQRDVQESEAKYRRIVDTSSEGIWMLGPDARTTFVNARMAEMLGRTIEEMKGSRLIDFMFAEDTLEYYQKIENRRKGMAETYERRFRHKDGRTIWTIVSATPILDASHNFLGSFAMFTDITERRLAEEELLRYKDQLEETVQQRTSELMVARDAAEAASKAKSIFLANMSHELRTPLNAVLGFSSMMRCEPDITESQRENLDIINRSGEHLLTLINDVLEIAKIEAGRVSLDTAAFDLGAMVRDVTDMMRHRAEEKGLRLEMDQSSEFPRYIKGDEPHLRQVLVNLVGNAIKFTQHGSVTIRLNVKQNAQQHLIMEVEDTGPGIAPEDQKRLFKPFVQLGEAGVQKGTGLGLAISRQFVELMGGIITVKSTVGKGSIFRIELVTKIANEKDIGALQKTLRVGDVVGTAPGTPKYRILIAEDQPENQLLLSQLMTRIGLDVKLAENGETCINLFQQWQPHLIWMDRQMPVMDGMEAMKRIRQLPGGHEVKIVAVTASVFKEQQVELLSSGMDAIVSKPYRFHEIYNCMAKQLSIKYLYHSNTPIEEASPTPLTPETLDVLSDAMRNELRNALECLDSDRLGTIIRNISKEHSELARSLARLAENFDYPAMLDALSGKRASCEEAA